MKLFPFETIEGCNLFYTVPAATEALIISGGFRRRSPDNPFRIVVGSGAFWIPGLHRVQKFYIGAHNVKVSLEAQTEQNITIQVAANVVFRVATSGEQGIRDAAGRFLDNTREEMEDIARDIFSAETRSLIGQRSVESIISNRMALASDVITNTEPKMLDLGWQVDSYQISSITDQNGHIANLSKPELVRVQLAAEIAEADARAKAEERNQEAERQVSLYRKETDLQVSKNTMETAEARAEAAQSGPRTEAEAKIAVAQKETALAEALAMQREAQLLAEVVKPAEAQAQAQRIAAEAEADAMRLVAEAAASNDRAALDKQMVDQMPEMLQSLAQGLSDGNMTFVGDSNDLMKMLSNLAGAGTALRDSLKPS